MLQSAGIGPSTITSRIKNLYKHSLQVESVFCMYLGTVSWRQAEKRCFFYDPIVLKKSLDIFFFVLLILNQPIVMAKTVIPAHNNWTRMLPKTPSCEILLLHCCVKM